MRGSNASSLPLPELVMERRGGEVGGCGMLVGFGAFSLKLDDPMLLVWDLVSGLVAEDET